MIIKIFYTISLLLFTSMSLHAQEKVKLHVGVEIGGITQWIGAKSDDDSKPLLLFLHGGPGFSSRPYSKKFIKHLKKDFIVAQWDQRGTGITAAWNSNADTLSLELMHSDTKEVVEYLMEKFGKKKLYLVGFSWGGFLGLQFADRHPELLHAYISVSSMIHGNESDSLALEIIHGRAKKSKNTEALAEIKNVKVPVTSWEELYFLRKWSAFFSGAKASKKQYPERLFKEWSVKWLPIYLEASNINYSKTIPEIHCPAYFFLSSRDLIANYKLTEQFYEGLDADPKKLIWFDESTHEIPTQEPKKFAQELIAISAPVE